jgi:hypothetical protein
MSGVPPRALPKISSSVGRKDSPTAAAAAAWSICANALKPRALTSASNRFMVSSGPYLLRIVVNPRAAMVLVWWGLLIGIP